MCTLPVYAISMHDLMWTRMDMPPSAVKTLEEVEDLLVNDIYKEYLTSAPPARGVDEIWRHFQH